MFLNSPKNIDQIELQDLLEDMIQLPEVFENARLLLVDVDMKKEKPDAVATCINILDHYLGGCQMYFEYIEPLIKKYYWFEERVKKGQPTE